jgi:SAM-dependent methyltransferase
MPDTMNPQACVLCGEIRSVPLFHYDAPDAYERAVGVANADYGREWVGCCGCGLRYARYSRDPNVLDRLYDDGYRDKTSSWRQGSAEETFARVIALPPDQSETVARCSSIKSAIERFATSDIHVMPERRPLRLLDVGGATGVFAYMFKDNNWSTEIADPGAQGRFVEQYGVRYHQRRFDGEFDGGPYDLISMVYVLEHVADPAGVVARARAVLGDGGLLYIEVPDEIAFEKKPQDDDIFNSCHLWMFGPGSLTSLLNRCAFDPLEVRRMRTHRGHYAVTALARPI